MGSPRQFDDERREDVHSEDQRTGASHDVKGEPSREEESTERITPNETPENRSTEPSHDVHDALAPSESKDQDRPPSPAHQRHSTYDEPSRKQEDQHVTSDAKEEEDQYDTRRSDAPAMESNRPELINLFVRNVAKHVVEQQLVDLFSKYGSVNSAVVVRDPHSKECRGFGFVKMESEEGAKEVIDVLQDYEFEGRRISVERAKRSAPHSRTPGAYMGIDRRIRDRYAGMKRTREYDGGQYPPPYDMRGGGGFRGRQYDPARSRPDDRAWDYRMAHDGPPTDERDRARRRYSYDGPRYPPTREFERDQRYREREPPVPRESADEYI